MQADTLTVLSCYHMHGKLSFNWQFMYSLMFMYSQHNILSVSDVESRAGGGTLVFEVGYPRKKKKKIT